jgi:ABC-type multidrug transport system fused ATPase/permease subunit
MPQMEPQEDNAEEQRALPPGSGRIFRRLLALLRPQWPMILLGMLLLLASIPGELIPGLIALYVVDHLIQDQQTAWPLHVMVSLNGRLEGWPALLISASAWMTVIYIVCTAAGALSTNILERVAQRFILQLRNRIYQKLQGQSLSYLQRQRTGDLMSRAIADVNELQAFIVTGIESVIGEGLLWVSVVIMVFLIDWQVASVTLAPLVIVYLLLRTFNKWIAPIYRDARESAGNIAARLQENLTGVVVIKIFGREREEAERFDSAAAQHYRDQVRAINARTVFFPFTRAVGFLSNVAMIGFGGYSILTGGTFTVGKLLAFRSYWWRLFGPIYTLARVNDMVQRAIAAGRRVFEVLDAPDDLPERPGAVSVMRVTGTMELHRVSFRYPSDLAHVDGPEVLHDVTIHIRPGQTVALCGPSGSGKSTVLNLLLRFYDPTEGAVLLDGRDMRSIRRESLRRHFALVQQETFLFNDSIIDNIRYGHTEATMEQVIAAAKAANAHGFISELPRGYDTRVGERGVRLSGGQKQRISIARAFLANPTILLLDEPTSSVEPDSEVAIIAALDRLMTGRTTVLTSHRPSLINQAEVVYVIERGRVTASGRPDELRRAGGWFERFMRTAEEPLAEPEPAE